MASSTTRDAAIYRCSNTGDTEANLPDDESVGMDVGMSDATPDLGIIIFNWKLPSRRTAVPAPLDKSSSNPDTGITPPTLIIGIKVNEKVANNRQVGLLTKWALQDKEVRTKFSKGRFGIRNNKKKWMNFQPTATAGWKIVDNDSDDVLEYGGMFDILLTLEFGGATSELVTAIQALIDSGTF